MDKNTEKQFSENLEQYRIKYSFYKVFVGTSLVGLFSILIPGAIQFWSLQFEQHKFELENRDRQQQYVNNFVSTALNQDVELRIRFSEYFANVSPAPFKDNWKKYHESLKEIRNNTRNEIHKKEKELSLLNKTKNPRVNEEIQISQLTRELEWRYQQIGYVTPNRSVVPSRRQQQEFGERVSVDYIEGSFINNKKRSKIVTVGPMEPGVEVIGTESTNKGAQ